MAQPGIVTRGDLVDVASLRPSSPATASLAADINAVRRELAVAAQRENLHPALVEAVAWQESRLRPGAVSPKGAVGVMQLMPGTARQLGVVNHDTRDNIRGGARYLRLMLDRYRGDVAKALAAYNAGPGAVDRYGGIPPYAETQTYVRAVLARLAATAAQR